MDHRHQDDRQPAARLRHVAAPLRPTRQQGKEHLLRTAPAARTGRPLVAIPAETARQTAVPRHGHALRDDRSGHRGLPQPATDAAQGARLCLCGLVLCLRHLDRTGHLRHRGIPAENHHPPLSVAQEERDGRHMRGGRHVSGCAAADGESDMGRPRPLRALRLQRLRTELSREHAEEGSSRHPHRRRQRHLPAMVQP